jgi:hypothetical protein
MAKAMHICVCGGGGVVGRSYGESSCWGVECIQTPCRPSAAQSRAENTVAGCAGESWCSIAVVVWMLLCGSGPLQLQADL